jgi:hypothetical protein
MNGNLDASAPGFPHRKYCYRWLVALLVMCGGVTAPAQTSVRAWGCLLYASNVDQSFELPPRLAYYGAPLRRSLGYSNYRVIAQHEIAVETQAENLLVSAVDIQVLLTGLARAPDGKYLVELLFTEGAKQVMEAQAKVGQGSPLFIRGPEWRDGRIIIVVMVAA